MKVFLIVLAVLILIVALILSVKAELTVIFENGWSSKIKVLFFERDIKLTQLLSFIVSPDQAGKEAAEKSKQQKEEKKNGKKEQASDEGQGHPDLDQGAEQADETPDRKEKERESTEEVTIPEPAKKPKTEKKPEKKNPIQKILDEDGVVGILLLVSNLLQTVNTVGITLIKGLHIYSLYVKMIIGGGDAADIGEKYGALCGWYYPLKGMILNQLKVDQYDDLIIPDFIAPRSEYEFQFIGSISVGLLFKVLLKAGKTFLVNYIKNR